MKDLPKGIRLRNPGNVERREAWEGLTPDQPDPRFCQFEDLEHGYRCLARILIAYGREGVRTCSDIAQKYAPPEDHNATGAYAQVLARFAGCGIFDRLDFADHRTLERLCAGVTFVENLAEAIAKGVEMALGRPAA